MRASRLQTSVHFFNSYDTPIAPLLDGFSLEALSPYVPANFSFLATEHSRTGDYGAAIRSKLESFAVQPSGILDTIDFDEDLWRSCATRAFNAFCMPDQLTPLKLYDVALPPNSAAGFGYGSARRGDVHTQSTDRAIGALGQFNLHGENQRAYTPYLGFTRSQLSTLDKPKERLVFGAADHNLRIECSLTYPFNDWLKWNSAYGYDYSFVYGWDLSRYQDFRRNFHRNFGANAQYGWFDWSGWDSSLEPEEIEDCFSHIGALYPNEARERVQFSSTYYKKKTVVLSKPGVAHTGELWELDGWGPSGSGFTHIVNNFGNYRRSHYIRRLLDVDAMIHFAQDDALWSGYRLDRLEQSRIDEICKIWPTSHLKVEGCISGDPDAAEFLSYTTPHGMIHRDAFRIYCLAIFLERPLRYPSPEHSAGRLRGIQLSVGDEHRWLTQAAESIEARFCAGRRMSPLVEQEQRPLAKW